MTKNTKRLLALLLALMLCAALLPAAALAEEDEEPGTIALVEDEPRDDPEEAPEEEEDELPILPPPAAPEDAEDVEISESNFPDAVFRSYVAENFDGDRNGWLSGEERLAVTLINLNGTDVANLDGIGFFPELTELDANGVYAEHGPVERLDLSGNGKLENLNISYQSLAEVDLSPCPALKIVYLEGNLLSRLDVSPCPGLETLSCGKNDLTQLDVSACRKLIMLGCGENKLTQLDVSRCSMLEELSCNGNDLTQLNTLNNHALVSLDCSDNDLIGLNLSGNLVLRFLYCQYNNLTGLDLVGSELTILKCQHNRLTKLNLSSTRNLAGLYCHHNSLIYLDISQCSSLKDVYLNGRRLERTDEGGYILYVYTGDLGVDADTYIDTEGTGLPNPFTDVKEGKYYYDAVLWAYYSGITKGTDDTHFSPNQTCTREQIATFLWKACGSPEPSSTENPFVDVKPGKYYTKAVLWAVENNITSGVTADKFGVGRPCTREQAMTFLWKAAGSPASSSTVNPFLDVKTGKYYYNAVLWAVNYGITRGVSTDTFGVGKTCTRAQIVTFLYAARDVLGE